MSSCVARLPGRLGGLVPGGARGDRPL